MNLWSNVSSCLCEGCKTPLFGFPLQKARAGKELEAWTAEQGRQAQLEMEQEAAAQAEFEAAEKEV